MTLKNLSDQQLYDLLINADRLQGEHYQVAAFGDDAWHNERFRIEALHAELLSEWNSREMCKECGMNPCSHQCPNSEHYYSVARELADEPFYGMDRHDGYGDPEITSEMHDAFYEYPDDGEPSTLADATVEELLYDIESISDTVRDLTRSLDADGYNNAVAAALDFEWAALSDRWAEYKRRQLPVTTEDFVKAPKGHTPVDTDDLPF